MPTALRVALLDDDVHLRTELRGLLEEMGYSVVLEAGDGRQGLSLLADVDVDVVVTDLKMPVLNGLEVAAALHGVLPVVVLSAFDDAGLQDRARQLGATFLVKGCRSGRIVAAIEAARPGERPAARSTVP